MAKNGKIFIQIASYRDPELLPTLKSLLENAKQNITDLIWSIKPKPEKVTDFATKLRENFYHMFKENKIEFAVKEINLSEKEEYILQNSNENKFIISKSNQEKYHANDIFAVHQKNL